MMKQKKLFTVLGALAILGAIVGFSIHANRQDSVAVQNGKVVRRETLIAKVSATGEIKPKEYVELQAEIAGVIADLRVREGDRVQQGDILLRIDPVQTEAETRIQQAILESSLSELNSQKAQIQLQETNIDRDRAALRVAEAEAQRAQQALEIARNAFKRKQELFEENLISRDLYEAAKNELINAETVLQTAQARLEQARAELAVAHVVLEQTRNSYRSALSRVDQARAALERSRDLLAKTVIRSPLTGVITQLNVEVGERAVPGTLNNPMATLMIIANLSVIEAEVQVDETDIVNVELGQEAEIKVDAFPGRILRGRITEVGNSPIPKANQQQEAKDFKVVIQLEDPPAALRPGLSCTASITTDIRNDVLVVPVQAVVMREFEVNEAGQPILPDPNQKKPSTRSSQQETRAKTKRKEFEGVFAVRNGRAEFVPVQTGIVGESEIELVSGVSEGTTVVTGSYKVLRTLQHGDAVKIEQAGG